MVEGQGTDGLSSPLAFMPKNTEKNFIEDAHKMFDVMSPSSGSIMLMTDDQKSVTILPFSLPVAIEPLEGVDVTRAAGPVSVEGSCVPASQPATSRTDKPMTRVLVVAKSNASRKILTRLLTRKGYIVHTAEDGLECLRMMDNSMPSDDTQRYSLVIIYDQTLICNGPAISLELRANGYRGIICGVTGRTSPQDIINFKHHGANLVLSKPLNVDVMEGIIKDFVF